MQAKSVGQAERIRRREAQDEAAAVLLAEQDAADEREAEFRGRIAWLEFERDAARTAKKAPLAAAFSEVMMLYRGP
jgi:hypothetical protein